MNKPRFFRSAALAATLAWAATAALAQGVAERDVKFITQAAQGGMFEIESSKMAQVRSTMPEVKNFATMMITDHGKAGEELKALAQTKSVPMPTGPSEKQQSMLQKLSTVEAAKFDNAYAEDSVDAHEDTVKLFKDAAKDSKDAELKAYASRTLPTLEQHLKMAKTMESAVDKKR